MSKYYYFVAQLPYLDVQPDTVDSLPMKYADFYELASRFLNEKDMKLLSSLSLEPSCEAENSSSSFLNAWNDWEKNLRIALAQIRAANMKKEFDAQGVSVPANIQQIAKNACAAENPLEAEKMLNIERLKMLNDLTPLDNFCSDAIFAYGLKLQMAERINKFNKETGLRSYHEIYDEILGDAK